MKTELLITMFMLLGITIDANAQKVEKDGIYYTINEEAATVTGSINDIKQANIAESVEYDSKTYPVTGIKRWAFSNEENLSTLSIPSSITYIGTGAFVGCIALSKVTFPSETPYQLDIQNTAFQRCSSLSSINFPEGITSIGDDAFERCSSLEQVTFPNSLRSIEASAFKGTILKSIIIPKGVAFIAGGAFRNCPLETIEVSQENSSYFSSDNVLFDKDQKTIILYPYLKAGTEYAIPNTVDSISAYCFNKCSNLSSVILPEGLKKIGDEAFSSSGLTSIIFPEGISFIGNMAFGGCKKYLLSQYRPVSLRFQNMLFGIVRA